MYITKDKELKDIISLSEFIALYQANTQLETKTHDNKVYIRLSNIDNDNTHFTMYEYNVTNHRFTRVNKNETLSMNIGLFTTTINNNSSHNLNEIKVELLQYIYYTNNIKELLLLGVLSYSGHKTIVLNSLETTTLEKIDDSDNIYTVDTSYMRQHLRVTSNPFSFCIVNNKTTQIPVKLHKYVISAMFFQSVDSLYITTTTIESTPTHILQAVIYYGLIKYPLYSYSEPLRKLIKQVINTNTKNETIIPFINKLGAQLNIHKLMKVIHENINPWGFTLIPFKQLLIQRLVPEVKEDPLFEKFCQYIYPELHLRSN